jgi:hypothetical protein
MKGIFLKRIEISDELAKKFLDVFNDFLITRGKLEEKYELFYNDEEFWNTSRTLQIGGTVPKKMILSQIETLENFLKYIQKSNLH